MAILEPFALAIGFLLSYSYDFTNSYGFSIVVLTVIINIVIFPLTLRQTRSTKRMQDIQPELKKLQKQHKDDKRLPHLFEFSEPSWKAWNDYDIGAIFGVKIKDNLGVFTEGRYLYYWERPAYDIKLGVNYQFMGF